MADGQQPVTLAPMAEPEPVDREEHDRLRARLEQFERAEAQRTEALSERNRERADKLPADLRKLAPIDAMEPEALSAWLDQAEASVPGAVPSRVRAAPPVGNSITPQQRRIADKLAANRDRFMGTSSTPPWAKGRIR